MTLSMMGIGFLSAFALGPAGFNIIRSLLTKKRWPWPAILGFLAGDLIYILLSVLLIKSPLLHHSWLEKTLTMLTVLALLFYAVKVLFLTDKEPLHGSVTGSSQGFRQSLLLTLSNFHLVFIYAGIFLSLTDQASLGFGIFVYVVSFVAGFMGLLLGLRGFEFYLKNILRKIEIFAACGFLSFSIYLILGIL